MYDGQQSGSSVWFLMPAFAAHLQLSALYPGVTLQRGDVPTPAKPASKARVCFFLCLNLRCIVFQSGCRWLLWRTLAVLCPVTWQSAFNSLCALCEWSLEPGDSPARSRKAQQLTKHCCAQELSALRSSPSRILQMAPSLVPECQI